MIKFRVGNNKNIIKSLQCKLYPVPSHDIRNYASVLHTVRKYGVWFPEKCIMKFATQLITAVTIIRIQIHCIYQ